MPLRGLVSGAELGSMLEVRLNEGPCQALVTREAGSVCLGGGGGESSIPCIHSHQSSFICSASGKH